MWSENIWLEECEVPAYVKEEREKAYREGYLKAIETMSVEMNELHRQCNAYRKELIDTLKAATQCVGYPEDDCGVCPYYYIAAAGGCPSGLRLTEAKKRLEELLDEKS